MDYRSRHPNPHLWPRQIFTDIRYPAHYGDIGRLGMDEFTAPDGTDFLTISGGLEPDELTATRYSIEADKSCPMRIRLENGELSWKDFWFHRGWLIEMKYQIEVEDSVLAKYISPIEMAPHLIKRFERFGVISPYELKFRQLDWWLDRCEQAKGEGKSEQEDFEKAKREYREFVTLYGHRIPSLKAA